MHIHPTVLFLAALAAPVYGQAPMPVPRCGSTAIHVALSRYTRLQRAGDMRRIAAFYLPDGKLAHRGGETLTGPDAIRGFLDQFRRYKVLASRLTPSALATSSAGVHIDGDFAQHVRLPDGKIVDAAGHFTSDWVCSDGHWRIGRLETY